MFTLEDSVTREEWEAYKRVQESGRYNMVMEASKAMRSAKLDSETYWTIINNYAKLQKIYC